MPKPTELAATVSSKGQVVIPGDVRRLKGRLPAPASPVSIDDMNAAVAARRARMHGD